MSSDSVNKTSKDSKTGMLKSSETEKHVQNIPVSFDLAGYMFKKSQLRKKHAKEEEEKEKAKKLCAEKKSNPTLARVVRIAKFFLFKIRNQNNELYCMFLKAVIPIFDRANILLQRDEP